MNKIAKYILATIAFLVSMQATGHAQLLKEWLKQKQTQREYLLQQIAALRVYGTYLKKGYKFVKDGTGLISDFTGGEFNLHRDYFNSLENVNPELLKSGKVEAILAMQQDMESQRTNARSKINPSEYFSAAEKQAIRRYLDNLENSCDTELEELMMVLTDGKLELTDDERIERIGKLYAATGNLYLTHRKAIPGMLQMMLGREREETDIKILKKLYGGP